MGLQPLISKVFLDEYNNFFLTLGQNNFGNKIPIILFFKIFSFRIRRVKRLENAMETQRIIPKVAQESKITPKSKWDISGSKQKKGSEKRIQ